MLEKKKEYCESPKIKKALWFSFLGALRNI
jgi:hypothetical protein